MSQFPLFLLNGSRASCWFGSTRLLLFSLITFAVALVRANAVLGAVYSYECDNLPEAAGWTLLSATCEADQATIDGLLIQEVPFCEDYPGTGSQILHTHDIRDLIGSTAWFIEWRVVTTGISDELIYVAPAHLVAFDGNGNVYHFSIADDQVRFIRDLALPILYFDITPKMFHTFRVEVLGENLGETYAVYIDGELKDSGPAESPFYNPPWQAGVNFGAKSKLVPSVTTWDYIRWGDIGIEGDFNIDLLIDSTDQYFFEECLSGPQGSWPGCAWADMDQDGDTDCDDWELFKAAWTDTESVPFSAICDSCLGDLAADGQVGAADLAMVLGAWGPAQGSPADLDGDGTVGPADLAEVLGAWGPCE